MFEQINGFAASTPWLHPAFVAYADYGIVVFAGLLAIGWWTARLTGSHDQMAASVLAGIATLAAVAINQPIVRLVHEPRPYTSHPGILVLAHRSADFSFPSDHAVMAGAVAAGLWIASVRLGIAATIAALALGFARVYTAAHYPHDVVAGLLIGATVAIATWLLARPAATRLVSATSKTRLRPLVQASESTGDGRDSKKRLAVPFVRRRPSASATTRAPRHSPLIR